MVDEDPRAEAVTAQSETYLQKEPTKDRYLGEVPADRLDDFRFGELPSAMQQLRGVHPRLYLTAERIKHIRHMVKVDPYYAWMFEKVRWVADTAAKKGPQEHHSHGGSSSVEQTWQRQTGNLIACLAFCYAVTGDENYLEATTHYIVKSMTYASWGLGDFSGADLAAGHQIYGIALAYDWLYDDLEETMRRRIRKLLVDRGRYMFDKFASGKIFWHDEYLQNHQWVNMTALTTAALALYDEVDSLDPWILLPLEKIKITMDSLGPDGASHEGVSYWSYGTEYLMKYMDLARDFLGVDFYRDSKWFANTAYYRIYTSLPTNHISPRMSMLSFGDSRRRETYGPDYHLRKLAREYRIGQAQWLADVLDKANLTTPKASWLNLLWYDPTVQPVPPDELPTFRHFDDMGLVFMRSGWSGDEVMSMFKCGPHIGRYALEKFSYDPGGSHVHPDAGELQIFAYGEPLLINDGYTYKDTKLQNTLTVDGVGQVGENMPWFRGHKLCLENRGAKILHASSGDDFDYVIGDATAAYEDSIGLKRFVRHVLYLKPACWVIFDEVAAEEPVTFELNFHTHSPFTKVTDGHYAFTGQKGSLDLKVLAPAEAVGEITTQQRFHPDRLRPTGKIDALVITNAAKADKAFFVVLLEAYPSDQASSARAELTKVPDGLELTIDTPQRNWRFKIRPDRDDPAGPIFQQIK